MSELMRLLCFEDEDQIVTFLTEYSLKVSSSGQVRANIFFPSWFFARLEKMGYILPTPSEGAGRLERIQCVLAALEGQSQGCV